jgi:hypothetical protein
MWGKHNVTACVSNENTLLSSFQMISKGHLGVNTKDSIYTTPLVYNQGVTNILGVF